MDNLIGDTIEFLLKNFTLTFFVIGLIVAAIAIARDRPDRHGAYAKILNWFLVFAIGVTYVFNGFMHTVFGDLSAELIGWENNGFQAEVGFASIGVGLVGFFAAPRRAPYSLKLAALIGPACFLWGAAGTHIADIINTGNMSEDNAGVVLYTDIFIPIIGFALWYAVWATRKADAPVVLGFYTSAQSSAAVSPEAVAARVDG